MAEAATGINPNPGSRLETLPFPTDEHKRPVAVALGSIIKKGGVGVRTDDALVIALHTKPNLVFHLQLPQIEVSYFSFQIFS